MNISVDGGALCGESNSRFGNYTFTTNLLKALYQYDKKNRYQIYTFCDIQSNFHSENFKILNLQPKQYWMKGRVSLQEMVQPNDIFLALNQSFPGFTKAKKIAFSHGLSFIKFPQFYKADYERLKKQLEEYTQQADLIVVSSSKVKDEIGEEYPRSADKTVAIPFGIPQEFRSTEVQKRTPFFFFCGMNHEIKNIEVIIRAFKNFVEDPQFAHYRLYLSGPFLDYAADNIIVITHQTPQELRNLYQTATAYLTSSHYESFNYPVLEALTQNCPVIALQSAVIPEMEEFVEKAGDEREMYKQLVTLASKTSSSIDRKLLFERFSWQRYVQTLTNWYSKL